MSVKKDHFIPKVYLKQWYRQNPKGETRQLYCFDYIENRFLENGHNSIVHSLDDVKFLSRMLYSESLETTLKDITEDDILSQLVERTIALFDSRDPFSKPMVDETIKEEEGNELFDLALSFFIVAFNQWARYPDERVNRVLFPFFKNLCDALSDKENQAEELGYRYILDYSRKGEFITSTIPVVPAFNADFVWRDMGLVDFPIGMMFSVSPNIMLRVINKKLLKWNYDVPHVRPFFTTREHAKVLNKSLMINCPGAYIIAGNKYFSIVSILGNDN